MLQKFFGELDKKEGEIIGIASTEKADRDGEVIKQDGWDLKNFKKNPVILASHNYYDFPIGKATNIKVEDKQLVFKMVFSEATQKAKEAAQLVKEGILKTFSVGFIPRERDTEDRNIITNAELLEISLVAVPANPQAVVTAKGMADNALAVKLVKEWLIADEKLAGDVKELEEKKVEKVDAKKEKALDGETVCQHCRKKASTPVAQNDEQGDEEGAEVDAKELDIRLIQKTTGYLQQLCRDIKKGGVRK